MEFTPFKPSGLSETISEKLSEQIGKGKNKTVEMLKREMEELKRKAKLREERWEQEKKEIREYIQEKRIEKLMENTEKGKYKKRK